MDHALQQFVLSQLARHRAMTIATMRPDGWPQATTVGYANDGLTLYFLCGKDSQKAANLAANDKVSITIDDDAQQVLEIKGLSMAAHACRITDETEAQHAIDLLMARYPEQKGLSLEPPKPGDLALFRVTPTVISALDYSKGFGHTDLMTCDGKALAH